MAAGNALLLYGFVMMAAEAAGNAMTLYGFCDDDK